MTLEEKARLVLDKRKEYKKYAPQTTSEISQYIIENILEFIDNKTEEGIIEPILYVQLIKGLVSISSVYQLGYEKDITPERYKDLDEKAILRVMNDVKHFFKNQKGFDAMQLGERVYGVNILKIMIDE